jgi:hypothetical protein
MFSNQVDDFVSSSVQITKIIRPPIFYSKVVCYWLVQLLWVSGRLSAQLGLYCVLEVNFTCVQNCAFLFLDNAVGYMSRE